MPFGLCNAPATFTTLMNNIFHEYFDDLLKKSVSEIWDEHCYRAFGELKRRLTSAPVLKFPEFKKPFEVHTDASDFAIGGVLMQEGRPVAFESKKLSDVERRWPTHEKEMWAVVHCLKLWQHYLGLEYTKVYTDNVSVRYFETQPKITPKQWRWADVLACFNVDLIHKPGRDNVVPDALSRRQELRIIFTGESSLMRKIREGYQDDEESKKTLDTLRLGKKLEHFRLEQGVVWFKQKRMLVPKGKLRLALLKECHDGPVAGHRGVKPTLAELVKNYYWPNLRDDVEQYVKSCVTCQQNRTQFRKEAGLLRPLPIPTKCWESVSMDFMTHLQESKGFDSIMVVVDRVSKMAHFVPTRDTATAQEVGRLYFDKVVKHHGMQKSIISDRDPKFTSRFWRALWKKLGTELKMSTAFRPQTDGQTERVNLVLQKYLRNYVNADQTDWADHISMAEFSYNNTKHSGTGFSPFMVVFGTEPLSPIDLALQGTSVKDGDEGEVVETKLFLEERKRILELAKETLRRAQKRYEKQVNKNRRQVSFKVGQKVWLNVKNFTLPQGLTPKFMAKFAGPFPIVKQVFDDAYKLALPPEIKVHPVFHVSLLKEYFKDSVRPEREQVLRPVPELVENHEEYEVETILNKCKLRSRDTEYLVKWRGYHVKEATWVPSSDLGNAKKAVQDFEGRAKPGKRQKG